MNSEKIEELFLALPFLLGHINPAALRNGGKIAVQPLYCSESNCTCHLMRQQAKSAFSMKSRAMCCFGSIYRH